MSDKPKTISCYVFHNWCYKFTLINISKKSEQEEIKVVLSKHLASPIGEIQILWRTSPNHPFKCKETEVDFNTIPHSKGLTYENGEL